MDANKLLIFLFIVVTLNGVFCKKIKLLSNFTNSEDKEFYQTTFPWIVKNIGHALRVKYYFIDGEDGGKRMCVMENLRHNLQLQTKYLTCEAEDREDCLKNLPLDHRRYDKCLRKIYKKTREAEKIYIYYGAGETPLIVIGRSTQTARDPMSVLSNICGMFRRKQPYGCKKPSQVPSTPSTTNEPKPEASPESTDPKPEAPPESTDPKPEVPPESTDPKPAAPPESTNPKPEAPAESTDPKPEAPAKSTDSKPEAPAESIDSKPEAPPESSDLKPEAPAKSTDSKPEAPPESTDSKSEAPAKSTDSKPEAPAESIDSTPKAPPESTDSKPSDAEATKTQ